MSDHSFYSIISEFEEHGLDFDFTKLKQNIMVSLRIPQCQWDIYVPMRYVCDYIRKAVHDTSTNDEMIKIICDLVWYDEKIIF